ncbi:MAG: hypothetical protein F8N36_13785 [Desulfovibrio sp.]|uniref:Mom family adenine methylcarbamoylation protein n=1 Tax=Desulfovibrio sp. TaxID=885 RepID=UPI00135E9865|nr:hypothetical protein [Desulfovibrio sp.]MTJ93909.1 hypothetical protein [Desulfovibrio sp.]
MSCIARSPHQLTFAFEQRWAAGREWRLPPGRELFYDDGSFSVDIIKPKLGKPFVVEHHYAHTWPSSVLAVGLWCGSELVGVANFGNPANEAVIPHWTGYGPRDGLELNRFTLLPSVGYGGESWFIRRAMAVVHQSRSIKAVISYADPVQRRSVHGEIIAPGHIGTIYQASGAVFCGRGAERVKWLAPNGTIVDGRALSKISTQECGHDYAERYLVGLCGEERRFGEDPRDYLARVAPLFKRFKHKGCLVYLLPMDRVVRRELRRRHPSLPYPKGEVLERAA